MLWELSVPNLLLLGIGFPTTAFAGDSAVEFSQSAATPSCAQQH